jgi:hypothetical protein
MVEQIEELRAELQLDPLPELQALGERSIEVYDAGREHVDGASRIGASGALRWC